MFYVIGKENWEAFARRTQEGGWPVAAWSPLLHGMGNQCPFPGHWVAKETMTADPF